MAGAELYQSKSEFAGTLDGVPIVVHKGEIVRSGHPILKAFADKFEPFKPEIRFDVEQATAAPGQKRGR